MKFSKELYSKIALLKAAYNFTDTAYVHLDADDKYYYVSIISKNEQELISEEEFVNEMLAQSVRHEIFLKTKNIRELLLARALATSVVINEDVQEELEQCAYSESEILKDWFLDND